MGQHIGSGGAFVGAGRPPEADQAFRAFEAELDAPSQAIERQNVGGRESFGDKRGHQDHPVRGFERSLGDLMTMLARLSPRLPPRGLGGLSGL
jgi:hypothetical protein